jgi:hypothetical protein
MSEVQERQTTTVVTNETMADFVAEKLGLNKAPTEAVVEQTPTEPEAAVQAEDSATTEAEPAEEQERKPNPKIERRFSEITKQREAARQEAERERQARIDLENKLKEMEAKLNPVQQEKVEADPKPKPEQFSDMYEYAEALAEWTADKKIKEEKAKEAAHKVEQERAKVMETWASRVQDFRDKTPDFDDLVGSADVVVSNEVRDAIFESDVGPQILYHLAENPDVAKKLQGMTAIGALRMIGKLEAKFEESPAPTPKETAVKTSKAPPPITPIKAKANGPVTELDDNRQFHGSYQAWKAARLAGRIR